MSFVWYTCKYNSIYAYKKSAAFILCGKFYWDWTVDVDSTDVNSYVCQSKVQLSLFWFSQNSHSVGVFDICTEFYLNQMKNVECMGTVSFTP